MKKILEARLAGGHRVYLRFDDGARGILDISRLIRFEGVFAALRDSAVFDEVRAEAGTICWPGEVDLDPEVLHWELTGEPIPGADPPWGLPKAV